MSVKRVTMRLNNDKLPPQHKVNQCRMSAEEIRTAIKKLSDKLGRAPTLRELRLETNVSGMRVLKLFGSYREAVEACGLKPQGKGFKLEMHKLFVEWASLVRKLGRVPPLTQYQKLTGRSCRPLTDRFGSWTSVPAGLLQFALENRLGKEWKDVLEITRQHCLKKAMPEETGPGPRILMDRPVYGECVWPSPIAFAPINEMGVVCLFGALAGALGFIITYIGRAYPDGEAIRRLDASRWQRVLIEFEFQSRNFVMHHHNPKKCDMIVCWEHNWPECPLEVLELKPLLLGGRKQKLAQILRKNRVEQAFTPALKSRREILSSLPKARAQRSEAL